MPPVPPHHVVLVGCGAVAREFYAPALRAFQNAGRIVIDSIVDPQPAARQSIARTFPRATQAGTLDELTPSRGSLAIVASPPRFHAPQTIAALEAGCHVLCEKPMASTVVEAQEMIAVAQRTRRLLAVGLYKRFFPASRYIRALCQDGHLGPLLNFSIKEGGPFRWPASFSFFDKSQTPGGVLLDIGVHALDLLSWWIGDPAEYHYADDSMGGLEANALLELSYAGHIRGTVHLSRDWATAQQYRFVFERGIVTWRVNDANGLTVQLTSAPAALQATLVNPLREPDSSLAPRPLATNAQSFIAQLANVLAAMESREPLAVTGTDALHSLQLIEQCYANRTLLEQPWLSPREAARAHECVVHIPASAHPFTL